MGLPWWSKLGAKLVLSRLPFGYALWQRLGVFRHGDMDTSDYAIRVFHSHVEKAGLNGRLAGGNILELGPGDSIATAVIAAAHGARAILVDAGRFVRSDIAPYRELQSALGTIGLAPPDISRCATVVDVLACCDARYLTDGLVSLQQVESASIDLIFSQAVLEHVRRRDFLATMQQCKRILKPAGVCSHQVDLRDHLGGALNNLRFSEQTWESEWFARSGFYTNRIQHSQMLNLFIQAGFVAECAGVQRWNELPTPRTKLAAEFARIPEEDLRVLAFDVLLR